MESLNEKDCDQTNAMTLALAFARGSSSRTAPFGMFPVTTTLFILSRIRFVNNKNNAVGIANPNGNRR